MAKDGKSETTFMRGARSFIQGRFETVARETFDDGWTPEEKDARPLETQVTIERARQAWLQAEPDRARREHRLLPADRAQVPHHAPDPRGARRMQSPRHSGHEIGAGRTRSRHPRADGREKSGARIRLDRHARP